MRQGHAERRRFLTGTAATAVAASLSNLSHAAGQNNIRLGQSVPLSGPAQELGIEYQRGLRLAFGFANAQGGVEGRWIELVSYDDRYEPEAALANTRDLLEVENVFALIGYVGAESVNRCLPLAVSAGLPFIAPLTGAESLRRSPPRALFHLRPGLAAETRLIAQAMQTLGIARVAVLQQDDADGAAGVLALLEAMHAQGMPLPTAMAKLGRNSTGNVELGSRDIRAAAEVLAAAHPQALVCLSAYATTAALLRALRDAGFAGPCYATSLSSAAAIGPLLGTRVAGLCVTQVVPSPFDASKPVVASYQQQLRAAGGTPEYVSLEGWIAGLATVQALRRMQRSATRSALMGALESLGGTDLGGFTLRWDAAHRQASGQVSLTMLDDTGRPRR
ncbi:ABC transporter substrate-binding protein [Ideonella sp.]|uniref:ABC transporter substrate-binding protein n=1 Tax=Ideonella sp. TaxID=1929293 RepID=UPI0035B36AD8